MTSMPLDYWSKPEVRRRDPSLGLPSISDDRPRQTGEREGGLSNLFSGMPEGYEEMIMAQRKEKEDLFSSYGKDPQDPSAHPMSGGRFTKEFMDYAKSKGYGIKDMTYMDAGMQLTKKEWDTEKKQKFPQFMTLLGDPGQPSVMPPQPPVPKPDPMVRPYKIPDDWNIDKWMPRHQGEPIPRPDPSLNPFKPPVQQPVPPSPPVSPRPEPKPGIQFPQLPTGQQVSNLVYSEGPALNPPSIRLKHGGSLTDKVLRILRNLS